MSKKCISCGAEMNDSESVCPECGVANEVNNEGAKEKATPKAKKKKLSPKRIAALAIVLIALVIIIVTVFSAIGNFIAGIGPKNAMNKVFDVLYENKPEKIEDCAPKAYWDDIKDEHGISVKDVKEYYEDTYIDLFIDSLEDECGKDIKVKYEFTDSDELSERKLDTVRDRLKSSYGILRKEVTKGYEYDVEIRVEGDEDYYKLESTLIVIKIDGKWYVFSETGEFAVNGLAELTYDSKNDNVDDLFPDFE